MAVMISDKSGQAKIGRTYSNILNNFNKLKDNNPSVRLNGEVALLNYIHQHNTLIRSTKPENRVCEAQMDSNPDSQHPISRYFILISE